MTEAQRADGCHELELARQPEHTLTAMEAHLVRYFRRLRESDQQALLRCLEVMEAVPARD